MATDSISFFVSHPDLKESLKVTRKGRIFSVAGKDLVLFPFGVLCEAISREIKTVRRWEKSGKFPKPQWVVPNSKARWYSFHQIKAVYDIHHKLSKGSHGFSHSKHFPLEEFFAEVKKCFYLVDSQEALKDEQPKT